MSDEKVPDSLLNRQMRELYETLRGNERPNGLTAEEYDAVYAAVLGLAARYIATDAEFRERADAMVADAQERLAKLRPNRPDALDWR